MDARFVEWIVYVYEGIPVISSNASYGESPLALSYEPICLHQAFSIINGHN